VEYKTYIDTATVGILKGKNPKKTIAFRSDIDALNTPNGPKHLCGHDGHMAILLGLIEYINLYKETLNDNIVFIFQPAEEGPGGARELVETGIFEKYNIDEIYGLHIYPEIDEGYIGVRDGYFMAQSGKFDIEIKSKSAHGAMPQNGIDAIVIASNIVDTLQTIVSRNVSPTENAVITIGKMSAGSVRNIVAEDALLQGTMRTFRPKTYEIMKNRIIEICKGYELVYNCHVDLVINDNYPAVNNNKKMCEELINIFGKDKIINLEPLMISEDFSYYQRVVSGLFFMLGSRNKDKGFVNGLHNAKFDFDKKVLSNGLDTYIKILKYKKSID
jgi:N-acetyldiaminopimelate deacetylase